MVSITHQCENQCLVITSVDFTEIMFMSVTLTCISDMYGMSFRSDTSNMM